MSGIESIKTVGDCIKFGGLTHTDQAIIIAEGLKKRACVTNKNAWYVYDESVKLYIQKNDGEYYTFFCGYMNDFVHAINYIKKTLKCDCDDKCKCGVKQQKENLSELTTKLDKSGYLKDISTRAYGLLYDTEFDKKVNIVTHELPIVNGKVINLKTKEIRDRSINDYYTFECEVEYIKSMEHANKFFKDVMPNDYEREYLQISLGYMLTGEVDARCFFVWYGVGSNGKSIIIDVMKKILKNFYVTADKNVFCKAESNAGQASPHLYALLGKRAVGYSEGETSDNSELDFSTLKRISGDDEISCRGLWKDQIEFKSQAKLNYLSNHIPRLSGEEAVVHRFRLIPFNEQFVENPTGKQKLKDTDFTDKLKTIYLSEMFSWIVEGAYKYYKQRKIIMPTSIAKQAEKYVKQEDSIVSYFNHGFIVKTGVYKDHITKSEIFKHYREYCSSNTLRCQPNSTFFSELHKKGFKQCDKLLHGNIVYREIKFTEPTENDDDPIEDGFETVEQTAKQPIKQLSIIEQMAFYEEQLKLLQEQHIKEMDNVMKSELPKKKTKRIIPVNKSENTTSVVEANFTVMF